MNKILREHMGGAIFYVTNRADGEGVLFKDDADYASYLALLNKYKKLHDFKLFAFALLPTHLHLLIELKEGLSISSIMHDLNTNYTKYFNSKYQMKGHLFQERSKVVVAEKENYLLPIASYVHLNPQALKITPDAKDYMYSSYPLYLNIPLKTADAPDMSLEVKEALVFLKGRTLAQVMAPADMDLVARDIKKKYILGSAAFTRMIEDKLSEKPKPQTAMPSGAGPSKLVYASGVLAAVLLIAIAGLVMQGTKARKAYSEALANSNVELAQKLAEQKTQISRGLEEKYRADQVSFKAMSMRLEIEKKKIKELEAKVK